MAGSVWPSVITNMRVVSRLWLAAWKLSGRFPIVTQLTKFALVGVTSFIIDVAVYVALTRLTSFFGRNYILANVLAFVVAVGWGFLLNKRWTFRVGGRGGLWSQDFFFCLI